MISKNTISINHYDILNNIITEENLKAKCYDMIKNYEGNQSNTPNKTELIRFFRHIALDIYFKNNNPTDKNTGLNTENIPSNIESILSELSSISSSDDSKNNNTVLSLQLSSILDRFLNDLPASDKKIYLYRYFFAYSIEDIARLCSIQTENIEYTLSQCNNGLKNISHSENIILDNKSLLLSFTDIDEAHLLSITSNNIVHTINNKFDFITYKNPTKTLKLYLNIFVGLAMLFLILLSIVQFTKNGTTTTSHSSNNSSNENEDIYIEIDGQKIVDGDKLLE